MVITLGTFTLCDGQTELPKDLEMDVSHGTEIAKFLRAKGIRAFSRGNRQSTVGFTVGRRHIGLSAAEQFVLTHDLSIPDSGDLVLSSSFLDGSFTVTIKDAVIVRCTTKHTGVTTWTTYQLTGGKAQ